MIIKIKMYSAITIMVSNREKIGTSTAWVCQTPESRQNVEYC